MKILAFSDVHCGHVHDSRSKRAITGESLVQNLGPTLNWFDI